REYRFYSEDLIKSISTVVKDQNKKVTTFDDFLIEVDNYFDLVSLDRPLTLQGFIRSKYSTPLISGLSIEIADLSITNDQDKIINFFNSRNWEFYVNTCKSFGFMVDKDVPWRITADIASQEMLKAASRYGFLTTDSILNKLYNYRIKTNFNTFKNLLNRMSIETAQDFFYVKECKDGSLKQAREALNLDLSKNTDEQYLKLYLKQRLREEEIKLSNYDHRVIESNMIAQSKTSISTAIFSVELFLSQPWKLSGSLTEKINKLNGV
ncbi:MAG: hypothetical protein ACO2ZP_10910, partial [Bacteriovoracaceae bacterium]